MTLLVGTSCPSTLLTFLLSRRVLGTPQKLLNRSIRCCRKDLTKAEQTWGGGVRAFNASPWILVCLEPFPCCLCTPNIAAPEPMSQKMNLLCLATWKIS